MRTIMHLIFLGVGFFAGIWLGHTNPQAAAQLDQVRAQEQAQIQPKIDAAVHEAKVKLLQMFVQDTSGGASSPAPVGSQFSGFAGAAPSAPMAPTDLKNKYQAMLEQETKH